jgi:hypothetical protein
LDVLRLISRTITVVALCLAIGLQWFALQSVAWTVMMVRGVRHVSFCQAVKSTFDGAHPCDLCKQLSKARDAEKKQDGQCGTAKVDLICVVRQIAIPPPFALLDYPGLVNSFADTFQQPPSPPPRAGLT